ncbi:MAG: hypothetical protein LUG52_03315 [Clostridia bacterium]|nr:hypothetical protein [Clostridia bacterium]
MTINEEKGEIFVTYRELLGKHIDELGKILIAFEMNSPAAIRMLRDEKNALALKYDFEGYDEGREFYEPACYNALAVIRSAMEQDKINPQLTAYVKEAKDELSEIYKYLSQNDL